jgi:hypothetical protein
VLDADTSSDDEDLCVADLGEERAMLRFRTFRPLDLKIMSPKLGWCLQLLSY